MACWVLGSGFWVWVWVFLPPYRMPRPDGTDNGRMRRIRGAALHWHWLAALAAALQPTPVKGFFGA